MSGIKEEYIRVVQGRPTALYAGLLDLAHARGLKSIETWIVQIPSPENGEVAVCRARVTMEDGRTFGGVGDASPSNVGRAIVPHILRQSETRAKARALRDAVNVGEALADDPSEADEEEPANASAKPLANPPRSASPQKRELAVVEGNSPGEEGGEERRTEDQVEDLKFWAGENGYGDDWINERVDGKWRHFTYPQAEAAKQALKAQAEAMDGS